MSDNVLLYDVSETQYHMDRLGEDDAPPRLSASCAKDLILRSPLHAWNHHPRLGGMYRRPSAPMENGTLIHALLLGKGREIVSVDARDWRTDAAKDARSAAIGSGKIAVLADKLTAAENTARVLSVRMEKLGVYLKGESEVTAAWTSPEGVDCRGRFDHLIDEATIVDIKTCDSAHPRAIQRQIEALGYDIQAAAYMEALTVIRPDVAPRFLWAFVETEPPFAVSIAIYDGSMAELGSRRWGRAKALWERCRRESRWPGYSETCFMPEASQWAIEREAMEDANV